MSNNQQGSAEDRCFCGAEWVDEREECAAGHGFGEADKFRVRAEKAEARVAELEAENARLKHEHATDLMQIQMLETLRCRHYDPAPVPSVSEKRVDETGGFRLGQLVHSKARPNECFVVTFAGRHYEGGPLSLSVRHFDDPNMQFVDVQENFTPLPRREPLIVSGLDAGVAQTGGERPGASPVTSTSAAQAVAEHRHNPEVPGTNPGPRLESASDPRSSNPKVEPEKADR